MEAVILPALDPAAAAARIGGLRLAELAIATLHRSGIERIVVAPRCGISSGTISRLAARGVPVVAAPEARGAWTTAGHRLIVVSADVVFTPAAVRALFDRLAALDLPAMAAAEASPGTLAAFTAAAADALRRLGSRRQVLERVDALRVAHLGEAMCRRIEGPADARAVERAAIRAGGSVSGLPRIARRLPLPLARRLLHWRLRIR